MPGRYLLKAIAASHAAVYRWTGGRLMNEHASCAGRDGVV